MHNFPLINVTSLLFNHIQKDDDPIIFLSPICTLKQNPPDGWYKLLTAEEGEFYNVPVPDEGTDLVQLKSQMRVSSPEMLETNTTKCIFWAIFFVIVVSFIGCIHFTENINHEENYIGRSRFAA